MANAPPPANGAGPAATEEYIPTAQSTTPATAESSLPSSASRTLSDPPTRPQTPCQPHHRDNAPGKLFKKLKSLTRSSKPRIAPVTRQSPCRAPRTPKLEEAKLDEGPLPAITPTRPNIKIRLVSQNMHDSLPSGDLSDLLGEIRGGFRGRHASTSTFGGGAYSTAGSTTASIISVPSPAHLPPFPLTPGHPYHLVIVAGQECPTASGALQGRLRTLDGRGWTSILEDWLCGGVHSDEASEPHEGSVAGEEEAESTTDGGAATGEGASLRSRATTNEAEDEEIDSGSGSRRGPYILVEKARLMGIFLAVFVARSCDQLVDGTSTGRVTAGLIGGRLGNKGGVGISLSFAGSRLLFISAHLAAHAHHLDMRKANAKKILDELIIDDFLGDGPKGGGVSDRFDQTFFMGDLNFRLNVSRLHADWILTSKDYATALEFDQLREVLAEPDSVFKGFSEGPIAFAPTYKYDIVHKVKKRRSTMLRHHRERAPKRTSRDWKAYEPVDVAEMDSGATSDPEHLQSTAPVDDDDVRSIFSEASALSDYERVEKTPDLAAAAMGLPSSPAKGNATSMEAVRKAAQVRFLTLVRTNSAAAAFVSAARRANGPSSSAESSSAGSTPGSGRASPRLRKLTVSGLPGMPIVRPILRAAHSEMVLPLNRATDGDDSSAPPSEDEASTPDPESEDPRSIKQSIVEAVFDSSSKQRVQSYTDRILFKSTVPIPDDPPTLPQYVRRGSTFVDSIKGFVHNLNSSTPTDPSHYAQHGGRTAYFDRPVTEASEKIRSWRTAGAEAQAAEASPQHGLLGNFFSRGRRQGVASRSMDSLVSPERSPVVGREASSKLKRSKSLQASRRASLAPSIQTVASHESGGRSFWRRRRSSVQGLGLSTSPSAVDVASTSNEPLPSSPLGASPIFATPTLPLTSLPLSVAAHPDATVTKRTRKRPTFSVRSSSSSRHNMSRSNSLGAIAPSALSPTTTAPPVLDSSAAAGDEGYNLSRPHSSHGLPRSLTRASLHRSASGPTPASGHGASLSLNRLKSFFHLPSLPFLNDKLAEGDGNLIISPGALEPPVSAVVVGPRKGEVQVLQYDAVVDLAKMEAVSDHRPVFAVVAVGVGGDPVNV